MYIYISISDRSCTLIFVQLQHTYETNITSSICILIPYVYGNEYCLFENNVDHTDTLIYLYSNIHIPIFMHAAAGLIMLLMT